MCVFIYKKIKLSLYIINMTIMNKALFLILKPKLNVLTLKPSNFQESFRSSLQKALSCRTFAQSKT